jgi:hypothetical protein
MTSPESKFWIWGFRTTLGWLDFDAGCVHGGIIASVSRHSPCLGAPAHDGIAFRLWGRYNAFTPGG